MVFASSFQLFIKLVVLIVISTLALCTTLHAAPFSLKTLKGENVMTHVNGAATITMIFQPDCNWCKKQGKTLAAVFEKCLSSVNVSLVGAKGSKSQLRKALKHYHQKNNLFYILQNHLEKISYIRARLMILIHILL